jgi:peroxiredoxin
MCTFKKILAFSLLLCSSSLFAAAAPDFTLKNLNGENIRLTEQRGQVIMLNFWASWCGPCRNEMPLLDKLDTKYGKMGFVLYGVNTDEDIAEAKNVLEKIKVNYPILLDPDSKVSELYKVDSMPFTVFIDKKGQVRHIHKGYTLGDEEKYVQKIKELISE